MKKKDLTSMSRGEYLASLNDDIFERITCVYYCDCDYCRHFDRDTHTCRFSGFKVFDKYDDCYDFECGVPFEYCSGDCDR